MADDNHLAMLMQGAQAWKDWRRNEEVIRADFRPNLSRASLQNADLSGYDLAFAALVQADLTEARLDGTILIKAVLTAATLVQAKLNRADLHDAVLTQAKLGGADLRSADFKRADLSFTDLRGVDLRGADLTRAFLLRADLRDADLRGASLKFADLHEADCTGAKLCEANLEGASLRGTRLYHADLTACRVYGISVWDVSIDKSTMQSDLVITRFDEAAVTVDSLELAQFIYLLMNNQRIRQVIDTITSKVVLILGRFTPNRKDVLDALREELRRHKYVPVLFDFEVPAGRDVSETVALLARMARFVIADLTEPSSIPKELESFVPDIAVPVQPLLAGTNQPYSMFKDYWKYDWVLPLHRYEDRESLMVSLVDKVIAPAEDKLLDLRSRRLGATMA